MFRPRDGQALGSFWKSALGALGSDAHSPTAGKYGLGPLVHPGVTPRVPVWFSKPSGLAPKPFRACRCGSRSPPGWRRNGQKKSTQNGCLRCSEGSVTRSGESKIPGPFEGFGGWSFGALSRRAMNPNGGPPLWRMRFPANPDGLIRSVEFRVAESWIGRRSEIQTAVPSRSSVDTPFHSTRAGSARRGFGP